ncbi:hypothetical protein [Thalassotalea maritima]|uniref:hypothetical protein n=1 Tax=Thalassotalea maritima TaxID=3242416 RepID=UPI0035275C83
MNQLTLKKQKVNRTTSNHWLPIQADLKYSAIDFDINKVCKQNQHQRRWILCIDLESNDVQGLAKHVDHGKLLRVNGEGKPISFEKIMTTLQRGNCSTVIIGSAHFSQSQLAILQRCAEHGRTECIIKRQNRLH